MLIPENSYQIHSGYKWWGWDRTTTGDGTLTLTDSRIECASGIGSGRARVNKRLILSPGESILFQVMARRVSGADATSGGLSIDFPGEGASVTSTRVTSSEWQEYSLRYTLPLTATEADFVMVSCGVFTSDGGEVHYQFPRVTLSNSQHGALRTWAMGMIQMTSGTPTIHTHFVQFGIVSVSYGSNTLSIQTKPGTVGGFSNPLPIVQMTTDTGTNALRLIPKAFFDRSTGVVSVQFVDCTTGAVVDAASYGSFRLAVSVVM